MVFWLSGWPIRKNHIINHATGAGTNYQVTVTTHYGSGTDSGANIYLNNHCRTDFGDIRFTGNDGSTLLDHWMESKTDSDNAVFWVEIGDDLSTVAQTIYIYYGKASATYPVGADQAEMDATFPFADHFGEFIDESANPVLTAGETWGGTPLTAVIEQSVVLNGATCEIWYRGYPNQQIGYATATDSRCAVWTPDAGNPTDIPAGHIYPFVLKHDGTYYMFVSRVSTGNIYLYSSTNKINWTAMNSGNPVLTHSTTTTDWYYNIYNVGVAIVGTTWHMLIEGTTQSGAGTGAYKMGYSYSTLALLNWNTHISADYVINTGGNPDLTYVPDRNALLSFHGDCSSTWKVVPTYASLADDLGLATSWHTSDNPALWIAPTGIAACDPQFLVTNFTKDHNIIISYGYNQVSIYQAYSDRSLDDFFDIVATPKWTIFDSPTITNSILTTTYVGGLTTTSSWSDAYAFRARIIYQTVQTGASGYIGWGTTGRVSYKYDVYGGYPTNGIVNGMVNGASGFSMGNDGTTPHIYDAERSGTTCKMIVDGTTKGTLTGGDNGSLYIHITGDGGGSRADVDWILVRKYVSPEPAHGIWGDAEVVGYSTVNPPVNMPVNYPSNFRANF